MKKIKYFYLLLLICAPMATYSQIKADFIQKCFVEGENSFRITDYDKIILQNPTMKFFLRVGNKQFPLHRDGVNLLLMVEATPKEIESASSSKVVSAKIIGKTSRGKTLRSDKPIVLSDIAQFQWKQIEGSLITIKNESNLGSSARNCVESLTFVNEKGISKTFDRKSGLQIYDNGLVKIDVTDKFSIEQSKLIVKYFGNRNTQEISLARQNAFSVSSETKCYSFQNRFLLEDKELLKNPAIKFYLQYNGKEFLLQKNETTSELFGNVGNNDVPLELKEDLMVKIVGKYANGAKIYSNDIKMYSARQLKWTLVSADIEDFHRGKTSDDMRFEYKNSQLAANRCIESVTFVDAKGFSKTYTRANGLNSSKGGYGGIVLNPQEFSAGQGKFIFKHFGNPATQEIPIMLYEKSNKNAKAKFNETDQSGREFTY